MISIRKSVIESTDLLDLNNNNDYGLFINIPETICEEFNYATCFNSGHLSDFTDFLDSIPSFNRLFWTPGLISSEKDILREAIELWRESNSGKDFSFFFLNYSGDLALRSYLLHLSNKLKVNILEFEIFHEIEKFYSYHSILDKDDKFKNMSDSDFIAFLNNVISNT